MKMLKMTGFQMAGLGLEISLPARVPEKNNTAQTFPPTIPA